MRRIWHEVKAHAGHVTIAVGFYGLLVAGAVALGYVVVELIRWLP